jgi:hypothetical protein
MRESRPADLRARLDATVQENVARRHLASRTMRPLFPGYRKGAEGERMVKQALGCMTGLSVAQARPRSAVAGRLRKFHGIELPT